MNSVASFRFILRVLNLAVQNYWRAGRKMGGECDFLRVKPKWQSTTIRRGVRCRVANVWIALTAQRKRINLLPGATKRPANAMNNELTGTVRALLDEYKKAIDELIAVVKPLNSSQVMLIRDDKTTDTNCRSIQTILTHVIYAGDGYITFIENHTADKKERPPKIFFENVNPYIDELNRMFEYTESFFVNNPSIQTEETDNSKKISASWGQQYDIEQLVEHAIVHVLKHRRQIQNFIRQPKEKPA